MHTRYQQIAMLDDETGELVEGWLEHESGEAQAFYAALAGSVRVGIEATGHTRAGLSGRCANWGTSCGSGTRRRFVQPMVRKQKTDARDAAHILDLLLSGRFLRIWRRRWRSEICGS